MESEEVIMCRILAMLLALCLCCSCCLAETEMASGVASEVVPSLWPEGQPHQIEKKELPFYFGALENP